MDRKGWSILAIIIAVGIAICALASGIGGYLFLRGGIGASHPTVNILSPHSGDRVALGGTITVHAVAQDERGHIVRVELWADGERVQVDTHPDGVETMTVGQRWRPQTVGNHTLVVRAFNQRGAMGKAAISVEAVEAPDADYDGVPDDRDAAPNAYGPLGHDGAPLNASASAGGAPAAVVGDEETGKEETATTPPDGDGDGVPDAEDLCPQEPGTQEAAGCPDRDGDGTPDSDDLCPDTPGAIENDGCPLIQPEPDGDGDGLPDSSDACPDQPGPADNGGCPIQPEDRDGDGVPDADDLCPDDPGPADNGGCPRQQAPQPQAEEVTLEFQALRMHTSGGLESAYCYLRLADDAWTRVPTSMNEDLAPLGGALWDIRHYVGENQGLVTTVAEDAILHLDIFCLGRTSDLLRPPVYLGEIVREHSAADWNGNLFTAHADGVAGWFELTYRICEAPCDEEALLPPVNLRVTASGISQVHLQWDWEGNSTIDGFRIYRDDVLGWIVPDADAREAVIAASAFRPPCSSQYRFDVRAFRGPLVDGEESRPSNPIYAVGEPCAGEDGLWALQVEQDPPDGPFYTLDINYRYLSDHGDTVYIDAIPDPGPFRSDPVMVPHGEGTARIPLEYVGPGNFPGGTVRIVMMTEEGAPFYEQSFDFPYIANLPSTLNPDGNPRYGTIEVNAGFVPDPQTVHVTSGGPVDVSYLGNGCHGYASASPTFLVRWGGSTGRLRFYIEETGGDAADTTMVVLAPDGTWYCNDDGAGYPNPLINIEPSPAGEYRIWVASYNEGTSVEGILHVTEMNIP